LGWARSHRNDWWFFPVIELHGEPISGAWPWRVKRLIDLLGAAALLSADRPGPGP